MTRRVHGLGDGDTSPDAVIQDDGTVLIRAERGGPGDGRVYQVQFEADDGVTGSCTGSVEIEVPHDRHDTAIDSGQDYDSTEEVP